MQIIIEGGAQNEISSSPENKEMLEVDRKGKEKVLQRVGAVLKPKQKPAMVLEMSADSEQLQFTDH